MSVALRLSVEQVAAAILLLDEDEKQQLRRQLPMLLATTPDELENLGWLQQAESAFRFWDDPVEDIYNALIPIDRQPKPLS